MDHEFSYEELGTIAEALRWSLFHLENHDYGPCFTHEEKWRIRQSSMAPIKAVRQKVMEYRKEMRTR